MARQCNSLTIARAKGTSEILSLADIPSPPDKPDDPWEDPTVNTNKKKKKKGKQVPRPDSIEEIISVPISDEHPERKVRTGSRPDPTIHDALIKSLRSRKEVFAWAYAHMSGISPIVIKHKLSISPPATLVHQKRRAFNEEKYRAIQVELFFPFSKNKHAIQLVNKL